jgi:hypothetical protein
MEKLFNTVINYGYYVRLNNLNGLDAWNTIKALINTNQDLNTNISSIIGHWNITLNINGQNISGIHLIYNHLKNEMNLHGDDGDKEEHKLSDEEWQRNHFYLQLARIPKNNSCNLVRLLQVAYNIGQLVCEMKQKKFTSEYISFFLMNRLYNINTFVNFNISNLTPDMLDYIHHLKNEISKHISKINSSKVLSSASASSEESIQDIEDITESITEMKGGKKKRRKY